MNKSLVAGIGVAAFLLVGSVSAFSAPQVFGPSYHEMHITFPTADGLLSGSDVLEAGAKVGYIADIQPQLDNTALVTIDVADDHWPLHSGLNADIRPKSLLGEKYISLHDGKPSARVYDTTQTLKASAAAVPVELDQFINSLDPKTRAAAQTLLRDLGAGVAARGPDLNSAIQTGRQNLDHLAVTGQTLANRDPELDRILVSLDNLLAQQTTPEQLTQLTQLINNSQQTLNAIETQQASFSRSFVDAQATLAEFNTAIDSAVPSLRTTLDTAPDLLNKATAEANLLAALTGQIDNPTVLPALANGITHGPTSTGGALENYTNGFRFPIFRICVISPNPASCTGAGGFTPQAPIPAPAGAIMTSGEQAASFASWMSA